MLASGISSELRAHQMAPGGVVADSSPPAGVVAHSSPHAGVAAHWSPSELSPQLFPFFRDAIFVSALPVVEMGYKLMTTSCRNGSMRKWKFHFPALFTWWLQSTVDAKSSRWAEVLFRRGTLPFASGSHCSVAVSPEEYRMSRCSAVFALATWQFSAECVDEGVSERSTEFGHHWFHVARVYDHSPLPVTLSLPMPFMQEGIWILHTVSSSSVHQLRLT